MPQTELDLVIAALRERNESVPRPLRLPTEEEVDTMQAQLMTAFADDYRQYLLAASDVVLGALEPAQITRSTAHTYLPTIVSDARAYGVPTDLLPICADNGNFYCLALDGRVTFWSHDGDSSEAWPSLARWIAQVWLGEAAS